MTGSRFIYPPARPFPPKRHAWRGGARCARCGLTRAQATTWGRLQPCAVAPSPLRAAAGPACRWEAA